MVMVMYDADRALECWPAIVFETDCTSVTFRRRQRSLNPMRAEIAEIVLIHDQWSVELVKRTWNERANYFACQALDDAGPETPQREASLGRHD